jgi:hypothetical protein
MPEVISIVPSFSKLSEEKLKFLIIAYDYTGSPFKMKPENYRIDMAEKLTGVKRNDIPESVKEEFISCIYDLKRDKKELFQKKLASIQLRFETESNVSQLKELSLLMDFIEKRITDLDSEILHEEEMDVVLKANRKLSLLEKLIRNRKLYNIDKKNKEKINEEL